MATIRTPLGNVKGPKGDTGATGETGEAGQAAKIRVGTTTTLAPGLPANVENVGTTEDAILNFSIPEGRSGSVGEIYTYPVNAITTQSGEFPVPQIGDTIATITGKQAKSTNDAKSAIQNILGDFGTVEPAATASKAYAVGDYLVLNGQFYKVTAAIAQGNTLTVGGNIEATNVGAEVYSLKNDLATKTHTINSQYGTFVARRSGNVISYQWNGSSTLSPTSFFLENNVPQEFLSNVAIQSPLRSSAGLGYMIIQPTGTVQITCGQNASWSLSNACAIVA